MEDEKLNFWQQVADFFSRLLGTESWPARWHCGIWTDFHGWLYIISDVLIFAAYFAIPFFLVALIRKKPDIPFKAVFVLFGAFILLCGLSHLVDAAMFWWPAYRLNAIVRFCTAIVSMLTVFSIYKVFPEILALTTVTSELKQRKIVESKLTKYTGVLESKNTQLTDFCNIVSHNLRGPLSNISMLVDYMLSCENEADRMEAMAKVKPVIKHLNDVFNELVESVQIRQDTEILEEKINLKECLEKVLIGFNSQIKTYEADVQINFNAAQEINYPSKYINSIFTNLISNALKYKSPDRKPIIKLRTENVNGSTILSVSDNGLGIDLKRHKDKLFKIRGIFHNHPDAKGFGLFMIKTQVEAMGGKIWAESTPDVGTTFFIEFRTQNI